MEMREREERISVGEGMTSGGEEYGDCDCDLISGIDSHPW